MSMVSDVDRLGLYTLPPFRSLPPPPSLRNNMFELADRLVGIYKTQNATKSVTINPHELSRVIKSNPAAAASAAKALANRSDNPLEDRTNATAPMEEA